MLSQILSESRERGDSYKRAAAGTLSRGLRGGSGSSGGGGMIPYAGGSTELHPFEDPQFANAVRQYKAGLRDHPYAAIRPVAVKIADLPFRCGTQISRADRAKAPSPAGKPGAGGGSGANGKPSPNRFRPKSFLQLLAPEFISKAMAEGLEQDDNHPLLDVFENPNPYMSGWAMLYCTAMSIEATGRSFWWIIDTPNSEQPLQLWYLPSTWVRPVHTEQGPFRGWRVKPPGMTEQEAEEKFGIIPFEDMVYFAYPDPSDPLSSFSPMQSQARAINTDEELQKAQFAGMVNSGKPGMVLTAGRLEHPAMTGPGPRPVLTPEQRSQLINAVRLAYAGAMHYGDPIIIDGLIESVAPYTLTPADLDFPNGSMLTKDRIFQGIGTNPIIAGQVEGVNRATSYVAQENFYANKVNPLATMMSQAATARLGPRFAAKAPDGATLAGGRKFYVWLEKAKAFDADLRLSELSLLADNKAITKDELREPLGLPPMATGGEELAGPPDPPPPMPGIPGATKPQSAGRTARKLKSLIQKELLAVISSLPQAKSAAGQPPRPAKTRRKFIPNS